jgi:hypothetical protein
MQQNAVRKHLSGVFRKTAQKVELLGRKMQFLPANQYAMLKLVDMEIANLNNYRDGFQGSVPASQLRSNPRQQFLDTEWLGYIVIGSRVERFDLLPILVADRKHQNGHLQPLSNGSTQLYSGHFRHGKIRDYEIRLPAFHYLQPL